MPATYTFQGQLLRIDCVGVTSKQEVKDVFLEGLAQPECPRPPALLIDVSRSTSLSRRTPTEMREMATFLAEHADTIGRRLAVVVGSDVTFGLIRIGSVHGEDSGLLTQVFRSVPEALEWLALRPEQDDSDSTPL